MNLKTLRQRCERLLLDIDVPQPFDIDDFATLIANQRGRPLRLVAKTSPLGPCGMWLALPDTDYVFYEAATTRLHRDHIVVHELAHLLASHEPSDTVDPAILKTLLPNLDPAVVQRVLARAEYSADQEQEAEMIASLVLQHAHRSPTQAVDSRDDSADAAAVQRLESTLGGARPGHRGR